MRIFSPLIPILIMSTALPALGEDKQEEQNSESDTSERIATAPSTRPSTRPKGASSDFLLLGVGAGISTDYAGADSYDFLAAPLIIGRYKGIDFATRGPGLAVDVIADTPGKKIDFILGPLARFRFDRNNSDNIEDVQVAALEELDTAVELGVSAGFQVNRIFHKFDNITIWVDAGWDVAGAHGGALITPAVTYSTPLSPALVANLSAGVSYATDDFTETYSSIDAADSLASGLPVFSAQGGIRDVNSRLLLAYDLDGDVRNGGWGLFALGSYTRLLGDTADSPIVTLTGSPDQFFGVFGVGYSF